MNADLRSRAASGSHSTLQPNRSSLGTKVSSLASMTPAFFLIGAGAVGYPDPAPDYKPDMNWVHYERGINLATPSLDALRQTSSIEDLVIAKLDSIFESLLASQQDLDQEDHRAIGSNLWQMYG